MAYTCPPVIAEFLSPKIARLRHSDPKLNEYSVITTDPGSCFKQFLSLGAGSAISVTLENGTFFLCLAYELENIELQDYLTTLPQCQPTLDTIHNRVLQKRAIHCDLFPELHFIAQYFYAIPHQFLISQLLTENDMYTVLTDPALKLDTEVSLYKIVRDRVRHDRAAFRLFEFVEFRMLDQKWLDNFRDLGSENLDQLNVAIWTKFAGCTRASSSRVEIGDRYFGSSSQEFDVDEARKLDGIIRHLSTVCGGNVHDLGVVHVTSSPLSSYTKSLGVVVQFDGLPRGEFFYTNTTEKEPWICYDFIGRRIIPTAYTIRTYDNGNGNFFFTRSWVIEASDTDEDEDFVVIDEHKDDETMNAQYTNYCFPIKDSRRCRYLRLRQTGPSGQGLRQLIFSAWEIFGTLLDEREARET
jgi:hypothetical protein